MTYSSLGVTYDRRQSNRSAYPSCATAVEKRIAKNACKPLVLRGVEGLGAVRVTKRPPTRFSRANPCWVDTLPNCPTCLSAADIAAYQRVLLGATTGAAAAKLSHLKSLYACASVATLPMPDCVSYSRKVLVDYCKKYPRHNGPDKRMNAACWTMTRQRYGGIGGGWWSVYSRKPNCPKCLTKELALAFADCVKNGQAQKSGPGIPSLCSDPRIAWNLCAGETLPLPALPPCVPNAQALALVHYCKASGGTDARKNALCYLVQRRPEYWRAFAALKQCPPSPPAPPAPVAPTPEPPPSSLPEPEPFAPPPAPEREGLSTGSVLLALAVVGGGAYWLSNRGKKRAA